MFKNILHMEFRATLIFRKFKVALNPMERTGNCFENIPHNVASVFSSKHTEIFDI